MLDIGRTTGPGFLPPPMGRVWEDLDRCIYIFIHIIIVYDAYDTSLTVCHLDHFGQNNPIMNKKR